MAFIPAQISSTAVNDDLNNLRAGIQGATTLKFGLASSKAGTPGNFTATGTSGNAAIDVSATACVITLPGVTTSTLCFIQPTLLNGGATLFKAVCTTDTITVTANSAATSAAATFNWFVIN